MLSVRAGRRLAARRLSSSVGCPHDAVSTRISRPRDGASGGLNEYEPEPILHRAGRIAATQDHLLLCKRDRVRSALPLKDITHLEAERHLSFRHPLLGSLLGLGLLAVSLPFSYALVTRPEFRSAALHGKIFFETPLGMLGCLGPLAALYILCDALTTRTIWWLRIHIWDRELLWAAPKASMQSLQHLIEAVSPHLSLGRCPRCNYDLRGMTSSGRCSECGADVPHRKRVPGACN